MMVSYSRSLVSTRKSKLKMGGIIVVLVDASVLDIIDCTKTAGGQEEVCEYFGIEKFPTLMYGASAKLEAYEGGRTFQELSDFCNESLVPQCSPRNPDLCEASMKTSIERLMDLSIAELQTRAKEDEKRMVKLEEWFQSKLNDLQAQYEKMEKEKNSAIQSIRKNQEGGLDLILSVLSVKKRIEEGGGSSGEL